MQNDCQIYVDPEEDEVFFGSVSEREKTVCAKLVKHAVPSWRGDSKLSKVPDECGLNVDEDIEGRLENEQSIKISKEVLVTNDPPDGIQIKDLSNSFEKVSSDSCKILSNTSVELEHNYSTPVKHKIDKSILATPDSIVKADKDGGFLKVLSEIALVKAEAEGDSNSEGKREDEDKENKIIPVIPEIKVTEATPEKRAVVSPPNNMTTEMRRFRIIYNSPRREDNINHKPKSIVESFESEMNFINKCLDQEVESLDSNKRKSVDLIDFTESSVLSGGGKATDFEDKNDVKEGDVAKESKPDCEIIKLRNLREVVADDGEVKRDVKINHRPAIPLRFSKEARKVVEVLKKSSVEDTLNFTIPEINLEEEENSFLSPEPVTAFDETVILNQNPVRKVEKVALSEIPTESSIESKTEEEEERKRTPVVSQPKLQPVKYFSERKICNQIVGETKKCVKRLPLENKRPATVEKGNGISHQVSSSRIPVFGAKSSRIPLFERIARPAAAKTTPSKTPTPKSFKNPKFNHIESPINAYINNKPTALVLNVKPEGKKENVNKVWKSQTAGSGRKVQEKPTKERQPNTAAKLPFVEYKSATPYKIEKRPESRLPRLAPTMFKLIGSHSPKVLRHEGRYYMNSPRKENSTENTIVADPNEVSVVVSQPALKSHTIK